MSKTLSVIGALSLVLWTGAGFLAWSSVGRHVSITFSDGDSVQGDTARLEELGDQVGALHADVRALAGHLGQSLTALDQDFEERLQARAATLEREVSALRAELAARRGGEDGVLRELAALRASLESGALEVRPTMPAAPVELVPEVVEEVVEPIAVEVPAAAEPAPVEAPRRKKGFLAFELPSDSFRFDQRATWTILPALSRVGFDAKSTLHDFSGVTSDVAGTLEVDPSRPQADPRGAIQVKASTLVSGVEGRDEAMRDHLETAEHPEITYEIQRFEAESVDAAAMTLTGTVHGDMTIRGKTHAIAMPVRVSVDDARRLVVEGETSLALPDFDVPVPNKLGVISMNETVRIWLSLKLRASAVAQD